MEFNLQTNNQKQFKYNAKSRSIKDIIRWIIGITFIFASFGGFSSKELVPSLSMSIMGIIILPYTSELITKMLKEKCRINNARSIKVIVFVLLFIIFGSTIDKTQPAVQNNVITINHTEQQNNTIAEDKNIKDKADIQNNLANELDKLESIQNVINTPSIKTLTLEKVIVSSHVDGDTVIVKFENGAIEKVRFIGVNTPETVHPNKGVEPFGKEASNYTKEQLLGKTVYLEKDVSERDKYGRLLRYVWIDEPYEANDQEIKSKLFNAILVAQGFAQVATYPPDVKYQDTFLELQTYAKDNNKGLWGTYEATATRNIPSQTKSMHTVDEISNQEAIVYVTNTGKKYHRSSCKYLEKSKISISLLNAKKSYQSCKVCNPPY